MREERLTSGTPRFPGLKAGMDRGCCTSPSPTHRPMHNPSPVLARSHSMSLTYYTLLKYLVCVPPAPHCNISSNRVKSFVQFTE